MSAALDADLEKLRELTAQLDCGPREREYIHEALRLALSRTREVLRRQQIVLNFPRLPRPRAAVHPGDTPPAAA